MQVSHTKNDMVSDKGLNKNLLCARVIKIRSNVTNIKHFSKSTIFNHGLLPKSQLDIDIGTFHYDVSHFSLLTRQTI